jgi:hypothetical protein
MIIEMLQGPRERITYGKTVREAEGISNAYFYLAKR